MKSYGQNVATEFSKKQIGVIYRAAKSGELKIEKWVMSEFYDLADFYGIDWNGSVELCERRILAILDAVFSGNLEKAQELINAYTESEFGSMSLKKQRSASRELVA